MFRDTRNTHHIHEHLEQRWRQHMVGNVPNMPVSLFISAVLDRNHDWWTGEEDRDHNR